MLKRIALAIALAALASGAMAASSNPPVPSRWIHGQPPQKDSGAKKADTAPDQRGTAARPLVIQIPRTPEDEADKARDTQREADRTARERISEVFTGILMAATVVLAVFTVLLWLSTRRAIKDANDGVRIANETLEHARESARHELRAYVVPRKPNLFLLGAGRHIGCAIKLKNVGSTPAYEVVCALALYIDDWPSPKNVAPGSTSPTIFEIWPKQTVTVKIDAANEVILQDGDHPAIVREEKAVYMQGVLEYVDAFDERQRTEFSFYKTGLRYLSLETTMSIRPSGNKSRRKQQKK